MKADQFNKITNQGTMPNANQKNPESQKKNRKVLEEREAVKSKHSLGRLLLDPCAQLL